MVHDIVLWNIVLRDDPARHRPRVVLATRGPPCARPLHRLGHRGVVVRGGLRRDLLRRCVALHGRPRCGHSLRVSRRFALAPDAEDRVERSVARSSPLGRIAPDLLWAVLWGSFAYYVLLASQTRGRRTCTTWSPEWPRASRDGSNPWTSGIATLLSHHGTEFSVVLAVLCIAIALAIFVPSLVRPALSSPCSSCPWRYGWPRTSVESSLRRAPT